ncbi:MAG TPA: sulfotransferase [Steroidobacteraceae bacterium]|nr:sulfotransferase [Steroidobacteraceae bacterium]
MNAPQTVIAFEASRSRAQAALRAGQTATAERWLRQLVTQRPGDIQCLWLLGAALLDQGRAAESIAMLERALAAAPDFSEARVDLARACRRAGRTAESRAAVRSVLEKTPQHHRAWLAYGDVLVDLGQYDDARIAFERARATDPERARIEEASAALTRDDRKTAEGLFREILRRDASHAGALCGLAAVSLAADVPADAERLLRHALRQSEHLPLAYRGLGPVLLALGRVEEADAAARHLQKIEPENPQTWIIMATVASRFMRQEQALEAYQRAAQYQPGDVRLLMSIGHVRKSLGRRAESESSYKEVLAADPANAEAWWSLADLKNYSFADHEVAVMQGLIADWERAARVRPGDAQLHFALGRALEQRGRYPEAFASYARGNAMRRSDARFDIEAFERRAQRIRAFFSAAFFAGHAGGGDPSPAPIFIVGLPRSGSTLIEQILASHSQVDGTMELPNIVNLVRSFEDLTADRDGYPEALGSIPGPQFASLGARYIAETAPLRRGRAHFTDKLPNNFSHVGLIRAILPNATVIDARRHPLDACFSTFRQHFASGQTFSYDLEDLGRYYRCYLSLMDHWDEVLPGKVLHLRYEELVRDPEANIRALLAHCGLPFEAACLSFHENARAVRTPSAEQVRQPIYTSAVGHWRHYANELEPLRRALGDCLARFD